MQLRAQSTSEVTPTDKPGWNAGNLWTATPFQQTQMDWVYASTLVSVTARVKNDNLNRIAQYDNQWAQFAAAMDQHPELADKQVAPVPPFAMVVVIDSNGWATEEQSKELVCPARVYTPPSRPSLEEAKIGGRVFENYFLALPGDITMNGVRVVGTSTDKVPVSGIFIKRAFAGAQSSGAGTGKVQIPGFFELVVPHDGE